MKECTSVMDIYLLTPFPLSMTTIFLRSTMRTHRIVQMPVELSICLSFVNPSSGCVVPAMYNKTLNMRKDPRIY